MKLPTHVSVAYAYPSSIIADALKQPEGCHYVATYFDKMESQLCRLVSGHSTLAEAKEAASRLNLPPSRWSL